ncbi:transmembrane protein, putative [Bodo saltans]|uniref:Transmembrane protein, putative n=1 Tax=Bodo saltans TaxID=75058 RepID=A0A0S4JU62_BODSA|nr:transmembrane protein, putative [Bodo saltans]|eukprot:CUG92653.1 transmembrane protein, putative [Bodo saltans]
MENYFNLKKSFVFYGAYHNEYRNQLIHVVGIPAIFTTALHFASKVPLVGGFNLSDLTAVFYATSFIKMEPVAGLLYAPLIFGMHYLANKTLQGQTSLAIAIHVGGWIAQFIGHGLFERRAPALLDNLGQAIHAAVFFAWLEVLFFLGYRPKLQKELKVLIDAEVKKFQAQSKKA